MFSFWVTVNDREYSRGLGVLAISLPARASIERAKLEKVAETAIAGEGGGEKSGDSARRHGSVHARAELDVDVLTDTDERLHEPSKLSEWCLTKA
jgi:hypothetical protein